LMETTEGNLSLRGCVSSMAFIQK